MPAPASNTSKKSGTAPDRFPEKESDRDIGLGADKRAVYFAFQGLLMAVLLLLFLYHPQHIDSWEGRFGLLMVALTGSLVMIRLVEARVLDSWWFQMSLFVADAMLATLTLGWTERNKDFFLLYFVIIFGTALIRSFRATLIVAGTCTLLYVGAEANADEGFRGTQFWLQLNFLWVTTFLLAILSRDTRQAQRDQEHRHQGRVSQLESLALLGQIAGEVAHRIKGPLTTIRVNADVMLHRLKGKGRQRERRELKQIQEEAEHCKTILRDLLNLGRIEEIDFEDIDLRAPLENAIRTIKPQVKKKSVRLYLESGAELLMVRGDHALLQEAVAAVLQNAVEAVKRNGKIVVLGGSVHEKGWVWSRWSGKHYRTLVVRDDGAGIAPRHLGTIFRPFFTTKRVEGSGLGLAAALRILQKHNGTIEAFSEGPGKGSTFTLKVPAI